MKRNRHKYTWLLLIALTIFSAIPLMCAKEVKDNVAQRETTIAKRKSNATTQDIFVKDTMVTSQKDLQTKTDLLVEKQQQLSDFTVSKINPWFDNQSNALDKTDKYESVEYSFTNFINNAEYGAFMIKNKSSQSQRISFKLINKDKKGNIELYKSPFIKDSRNRSAADPLIPVTKPVDFEAKETKVFFFKIESEVQGESNSILQIKHKKEVFDITIHAEYFENNYAKADYLNANNWAYLTYPMLKDRKNEAARDLEEHHINTVVIPPSVIPKMKNGDFEGFSRYLNHFDKVDNILLFTNYIYNSTKNGYEGGKFMSPEWQKVFKEWYSKLTTLIQEDGYSNARVYLYPYDEIKKKENIEDFLRLANWARKAMPEIKFYATLPTNKDVIKTILPLLDVAQINNKDDVLEHLPPHNAEIWSYLIIAQSRYKSPYQMYRLMAWKAYRDQVSGIGFWNYAHERGELTRNLISAPVKDVSKSYSVIYEGSHKSIISTRRWEAFRLGLEDYQIIKGYERKFGRTETLKFVKKVLNNPKDLNEAHKIRMKMLKKLVVNHQDSQ